MQIQINAADPEVRGVDETVVRAEVSNALDRFADQITRVEVYLKDVNGPRPGTDKHCTMEARLAGLRPMAVAADGDDVYTAVSNAAGKLQRLLDSDLGKRAGH